MTSRNRNSRTTVNTTSNTSSRKTWRRIPIAAAFAAVFALVAVTLAMPANANPIYASASIWSVTEYIAAFLRSEKPASAGSAASEVIDELSQARSGRANAQRFGQPTDINAIIAEVARQGKGVRTPRTTASDGGSCTVNVVPASPPYTPTNNDFQVLDSAVQAATGGGTLCLSGTFNFAESNALADWALGTDNTAGTADDYSIKVPSPLNGVTITSPALGSAIIQGPGDVASSNYGFEGVFYFDSTNASHANQNWTLSNLQIEGFDSPIQMYVFGGGVDTYDNTQITGNKLVMPADLDDNDGGFQNIAIHYSFGSDQIISGNEIIIAGDGVDDSPTESSVTVGMQSNTSGGSVYDGLLIQNNTITIANAPSTNPEFVLGIWENAHAHTSDISVDDNVISSTIPGSVATNQRVGFEMTSHTGMATTVKYANNTVKGLNVGFQWLDPSWMTNFGGNNPIQLVSNSITGNGTGILVHSQGVGTASYNRIAGNTTGINNVDGVATANNNWWGCNYGPGMSGAGCSAAANGNTGAVTASSFLSLAVGASPTAVNSGDTSTITANLNNGISMPPGTVPDTTPITFGTTAPTQGSVVGNGATTVAGVQTATFTAAATDNNSALGVGAATATVDGQTVGTTVNVHPEVISINRLTPLTPSTTSTSVVFRVTFSAPVSQVDDTDFVVTTLSGPISAIVTGYTSPSPFNTADITVMTSGGDGEIRLDLVDDGTIVRRSTTLQLGGPGPVNGNFNTGETYIIDNTGPKPVVDEGPTQADPTNTSPIVFTVDFNEPVVGFTSSDISFAGSTATGMSASLSGPAAGDIYTVTVTGMSNGTVVVSVPGGSVTDALGNSNTASTAIDNSVTYDTVAPDATINQSVGQADPTSSLPINFTVQFTEAVTDFDDAADITLGGVATAATITPVDGDTYTVSVTAVSGPGSVTVSVNANSAADGAGNLNTVSPSTDNSVLYTLGATQLVVDDDGLAAFGNCDAATPAAYTNIQPAVDAAAVGAVIQVCPSVDSPENATDSYDEDVLVNKQLTILGVGGAAVTIVEGPIGGGGSTFRLDASNVDLSGFTITRAGNNTTDWNNPGLNGSGIAIQGQAFTGNVIHDNIIVGNRTGIDVNHSNGHTIRNNKIDFNRTGLIFRNQNDNMSVVENEITNNWTVGILFLDASGGSNSPLQQSLNSAYINNNISGNWYGQIVDRQAGGSLPAPGTLFKNFQGNWYGTTTPVVTTANSSEPGYAGQIPVAYGGGASAPGGQPDIAGPGSANFRYHQFLLTGIDTNVETETGRGTFGFQGAPRVVNSQSSFIPPNDTGWYFFDDLPGTGVGSGDFENGPAGTPLGTGSARLSVDGLSRQILATTNYQGVRFADMTRLRYKSWQTSSDPALAPALQFDVDNDLADNTITAYQGRLVYEPYQEVPAPTIQQGAWQEWDLMSPNARFYGSGSPGPNRPLTTACPQSAPCTRAQILTLFPNIGLRISPGNRLLFRAGGPWAAGFTGFVDDFDIGIRSGQTTFDFESDGNDAPTFVSSVRAGSDPTNASSVTFTVTFSEPVTGVSTSDFALTTTGAITGASVTGVTPASGPSHTYTVTVGTGSGSGTIRLDVAGSATINDVAGNPYVGGAYTGGEAYTIDREQPTVTIDQTLGQADPTSASPISFTVVFNEPVTGFGDVAGDVVLSGTAGATTAVVSGSGTTYTVLVSGMTGTGTVIATVPANAAIDAVNNPSAASTSTDNTVGFATETLYALTTGSPQNLITFNSTTPGTLTSTTPITGVTAGETLVGIDFRPSVAAAPPNPNRVGALYGFSSNGAGNGFIYAINPTTGVATKISSSAIPVGTATRFGFDFNPTVDRIRLVSNASTGNNLRLNPNNGALTFTDGDLNGAASSATAAAYTNNDNDNTAGTPTGTQLFVINGGNLYLQNPPNAGTLVLQGPLGVTPDDINGFDISSVGAGQGVPNIGYGAFTTGSVVVRTPNDGVSATDLYNVDTTTGTASLVGSIGGGYTLAGLTGIPAGGLYVDATGPSVTIDQSSTQVDPTNTNPISFTAVFSEVTYGFTASDVTVTNGSALSVTTTDNLTFTILVNAAADGVVTASIGAGVATDFYGNGNAASSSTDNSVTYDTIAPTVTINQAMGQNDPTSTGPINFTVDFSETVTGFDASDISFVGSTAGGTLVATVTGPFAGDTYNVAVSGMTTAGLVVVSVPSGAATDGVNPSAASTSTDNSVNFLPCIQITTQPAITTLPGAVTIPVKNTNTFSGGYNVISADFTFTYDTAVLSSAPANISVTPGTVAPGATITANTSTPGSIVISVFSTTPFSGIGTIVNINMQTVGAIGSSSYLNVTQPIFNGGTVCSNPTTGFNSTLTIISGSVSGTVTYENQPSVGGVPNVTLNAAGSVPVSGTTTASGTYSLSGFGAGAYTITPTKPDMSSALPNGIFSNDPAKVAEHVVGISTLTGAKLEAAKVSGLGTVSSFDAALIAQWLAGVPNAINQTGKWKFTPVNRTYAGGIVTNFTAQHYTALLMGDVTGDYSPTAPGAFAPSIPEAEIDRTNALRVMVGQATSQPGALVTVPVRFENLRGRGVTSYQFEIAYDASVLSPAEVAADVAGTMSANLGVVANAPEPGLLRVIVYGVTPASTDGVFVNLRFNAIGGVGTSSPLEMRGFRFNDGTQGAILSAGRASIQSAEGTKRR